MQRTTARAPFVLGLLASVAFACSGGSDSTGATSSSGGSSGISSSSSTSSSSSSGAGSSSGEAQCGATCQSQATLTFQEANGDGHLDGAFVEACAGDRCEHGTLTKSDAGASYLLQLQPSSDGGLTSAYASVTAGTTAGSLAFSVRWSLAYAGPDAPKDGDVYTVNARVSEGGTLLFTHTFTATYQTVTVCGTVCQQYTGTQ